MSTDPTVAPGQISDDATPASPAKDAWSSTMDGRRIPFEGALMVNRNDFIIANTVFDFKAAPLHNEQTQVGTHDWLASWFPCNPQHITISFERADGIKCRFSVPEAILVENCQHFAAALKPGVWEEEAHREFALDHRDAAALGTILVFLMFGSFPQHPDPKVQSTSQMIDDLIGAYRLSGYLGLRRLNHLKRAVCLRLRQLLLADRKALRPFHLGKLANLSKERGHDFIYYKDLWTVFAQAAVKPWMHSWMAVPPNSSASTIAWSVAFDEQCGSDPTAWAAVVSHYVSLIHNNDDFAVRVMSQVKRTMVTAKRLNSLVPDQTNNKSKRVPKLVDFVTYRDPLPEGKAQIFTI